MNDRIDTAQWQRLGVLFDHAIGMDSAEQAELLRTVGREDAELAQALASLLAADARHHAHATEQSDRMLQTSLAAIDAPGVCVGDRVGPYILREEIGRGGMGVVFRAERADGQVQQEVALKIVKRALLDASGRERFLREREIVAAFQHPSIARMLDVGETADGSPYLVMELIRGLPITAWCDAHHLDTRRRVEVFLRVCEAVQHAHSNLVLHRDLKPSNVLVGEDGLPKLIDFGIAKPLGLLADEALQQTATAQRFFSPSNVAPEQLRGERVGVASCDVYQLGTLLHELLCGTTVFEVAGLTAGQLEQKILEVAPEAPSARAVRVNEGTAQAHGAVTPAALSRELQGDLDAIVAHALRKPPQERYGSVQQLAEDLRRYRNGEPVAAVRGLRWYRARKYLRRHALAVGVSMAALVLVTSFVTALWVQSHRIAQERDLAQQQAHLAQQRAREVDQVARFEADMLIQLDPNQAGKQLMDDEQAKLAAALAKAGVPENERAGQIAAFAGMLQHMNATDTAIGLIDRTTMKPAIAAIDKQFKDQPVVAARLRQVLADRYVQMGLYDAAMPLQQSALATRRRVLGDEDRDTLQSIENMGELTYLKHDASKAEPYVREALEKRRRVLGEDDPDTLESRADLGQILMDQGKLGEAEPLLRQALAASRRVKGDEANQTLDLLGQMGELRREEGKLADAERYEREAIQKSSRVLGRNHPKTLQFISSLARVLTYEGKLSEAEPYFREALETGRRVLGEEDPDTVAKIISMGMFLMVEGRANEAERYFREGLETSRRVSGEEDLFTLLSMTRLGWSLEEQGRLGEAEPHLRAALDKSRRALGEKNANTLFAIAVMGTLLQDEGKLSEAEASLREAVEKSRRTLGSEDRVTLYAITHLGALLVARNKHAEAEKLLVPLEAAARTPSSGDPDLLAASLMSLGMARAGLAEFSAAESDLLEAQPILARMKGPEGKDIRKCTQALIDLYAAWNIAQPGKGHDAKAAEWKRKLDALGAPAPAPTAH